MHTQLLPYQTILVVCKTVESPALQLLLQQMYQLFFLELRVAFDMFMLAQVLEFTDLQQ